MPTYTFTAIIGSNTEVSVNFDYTPADPDCALGAEVEINTIGCMHLNSIDDIMSDLSSECIERIELKCFEYVENPSESRSKKY